MYLNIEKLKYILHELHHIHQIEDYRSQVLQLFDQVFHLERSIFWLCNEKGEITQPLILNQNESDIEFYQKHYMSQDYLLPINVKDRIISKNTLNLQDIVTTSEYENSAYYNEFLKTRGAYHEMGMYLKFDGKLIGGISFIGEKGHTSFLNDTILYLELLAYNIALQCKLLQPNISKNLLTKSEKTICELIGKGYSNSIIAQTLFVSENTVKKHVQNIYKKLNVNNRVSLLKKIQ